MKRLIAASALLCTSAAGAAQYPAPVQTLIDQGVEVHGQFDAPGGLTGYAARVQGQPLALYLTGDGKQVIVGDMVDAEGNNLTASQLERHLPQPEFDQAWPLLEKTHWIGEGGSNAKRVIYVFDDPNCPYCKALWEASQPFLDEDVELRHVMVAVIHPTSMGKAARMLAADDPLQAYTDHQTKGSEPLARIPPALRQQIETNNRLMQEVGTYATPTLFYKDRAGKVRKIAGLPSADTLANEVFQKQPR